MEIFELNIHVATIFKSTLISFPKDYKSAYN